MILTASETLAEREPHCRFAVTAWSATSVQWPGPRRGTMAAGAASVNRPSTPAATSRTLSATLVVVESAERASVEVVTFTVVTVVVGPVEAPPAATGERGGEVVAVTVPGGDVGAVVVLVVGLVVLVVGLVVVVVVVVGGSVVLDVAEAPEWFRPGAGGVVGDVVRCSGRELRVKTSTRSNRGLDHISSCEPRSVNRRDAMVIED